MEVLHTAPTASSFTPLSVHESQTPDSFFSGPPILYHHSPSATLKLDAHDLASAPALASLAEGRQQPSNGGAAAVNGEVDGEEHDEEMEIQGVDVWATSERLILFSPTQSTGVSISYPTISLHAAQSQPPSIFLQLLISAQTFDDHDPDSTISLTIIPSSPPASTIEPAPAPSIADETPNTTRPLQSPTVALYTALCSCANLHPDPTSGSEAEGDDEGNPRPDIRFESDISGIYPLANGYPTPTDGTGGPALPPPMPGSGGWITAENVGDFFDEEGNWRGGEEWTDSEVLGVPGGGVVGQGAGVEARTEGGLGAGAGSVRPREEEDSGGGAVDGDGIEGGDETKWRRTE